MTSTMNNDIQLHTVTDNVANNTPKNTNLVEGKTNDTKKVRFNTITTTITSKNNTVRNTVVNHQSTEKVVENNVVKRNGPSSAGSNNNKESYLLEFEHLFASVMHKVKLFGLNIDTESITETVINYKAFESTDDTKVLLDFILRILCLWQHEMHDQVDEADDLHALITEDQSILEFIFKNIIKSKNLFHLVYSRHTSSANANVEVAPPSLSCVESLLPWHEGARGCSCCVGNLPQDNLKNFERALKKKKIPILKNCVQKHWKAHLPAYFEDNEKVVNWFKGYMIVNPDATYARFSDAFRARFGLNEQLQMYISYRKLSHLKDTVFINDGLRFFHYFMDLIRQAGVVDPVLRRNFLFKALPDHALVKVKQFLQARDKNETLDIEKLKDAVMYAFCYWRYWLEDCGESDDSEDSKPAGTKRKWSEIEKEECKPVHCIVCSKNGHYTKDCRKIQGLLQQTINVPVPSLTGEDTIDDQQSVSMYMNENDFFYLTAEFYKI